MHSSGTIFLAKRTAFFSVEKVLSATFIGEDRVYPHTLQHIYFFQGLSCNNRILFSSFIFPPFQFQ